MSAEAKDALERAMNAHNPEWAQAYATAAVAEATIALAEQQRIANLITYSKNLTENERAGHVLTEQGKRTRDRIDALVAVSLGLP